MSVVVTGWTEVFPQLKHIKFDYRKCNAVLGSFSKISYCPNFEIKLSNMSNSERASRFESTSSDLSVDFEFPPQNIRGL